MPLNGSALPQAPRGFKPFDGNERPDAPRETWPEIDASLVEEGRGVVPAFPLDRLPPAWAQWIDDTAQSAGTPADYVAQGVLASLAAVCGAGVLVRVTPAWSEPLVLWQALVGTPSSGKSPALAAARRLLGDIEDELRAGDGERKRRHDGAIEQARLVTETWKQECASAHGLGRAAPDKPEAATVAQDFVPTQLVVADSTIEALADVVAGNPAGVVLWRDELAAWLSNQGRYANGGSDRAHWLEAWSASGVTINRRTRERPLQLDRFPVSIIGTIQPDRIADALAGGDDGLAARFLYVWPDACPYTPLMQRRVADDDTALALLQRIAGVARKNQTPLVLKFAPAAIAPFDRFLAGLHADARHADGLEAGWLGKGPGTIARLAGALALLAWSEGPGNHPAPDHVGAAAVESASALWNDYFRPHARNVFNQAGRTDRDRAARRVVKWLRQHGITEVSREQIRRDALAHAVDAEGADRVIARLVAGGVLRSATLAQGRGRPARRWVVNPQALQTSSDEAGYHPCVDPKASGL